MPALMKPRGDDPRRLPVPLALTDTDAIEVPGEEFPSAVYLTIVTAFAWMLLAAWLAFAASDGTDLDLGMVTLLTTVFFAIPLVLHHTAVRNRSGASLSLRSFAGRPFETFTGSMPPVQAWIEVALIPVALALAATAFALVYAVVG